uniref:Uncharacterized protein n=2 Tax=Meloidogyne TaxID=189290 RepID=A0A914NCD6_MELIC
MPAQHSALFKIGKWTSVFIVPAICWSWIAFDYYDNYLYKTGQRKSLIDHIAEEQTKAYNEFQSLTSENSPYLFFGFDMGICSHLFIFAAGIYAGICFNQHYEIPKLPPPNEIYAKIQEYLETKRKDD